MLRLSIILIFLFLNLSWKENEEVKILSEETIEKASTDSLLFLFWNLENFFDYQQEGKAVREFSPEGSYHWTATRFYRKCGWISKSILWIASQYGRIPDVIGFAEVENKRVLDRLLNVSTLRKMGFAMVHYDSPDHRGIDVALLYRKEKLFLQSSRPIILEGMATRDLLQVQLCSRSSGRIYDFLVCHLPSKYGGIPSKKRRAQAASILRSAVDSLQSIRLSRMVVMGDFNDVPTSAAFDTLRSVLHLALPPQKHKIDFHQEGSIRFNGRWEWIDLFWTNFLSDGMEIVRIPFLMTGDSNYSGEKPLRTYSGPKYLGGVSDHCPIILKVMDFRER